MNDSHIHDLGKWTFATSFLWSYMWFSQFMLIWYANIGEEVIYFQTRIMHFKYLYFGMFIINFAFPMLILMSRDAKRNAGILVFVGLMILIGHWLDVYVMISAGSLGANAKIGALEIGMAADIVVWSSNLHEYRSDPAGLLSQSTLLTIVDGQIVHDAR